MMNFELGTSPDAKSIPGAFGSEYYGIFGIGELAPQVFPDF